MMYIVYAQHMPQYTQYTQHTLSAIIEYTIACVHIHRQHHPHHCRHLSVAARQRTRHYLESASILPSDTHTYIQTYKHMLLTLTAASDWAAKGRAYLAAILEVILLPTLLWKLLNLNLKTAFAWHHILYNSKRHPLENLSIQERCLDPAAVVLEVAVFLY